MRFSSSALGGFRNFIARIVLSQDQYNYAVTTSLLAQSGLCHVTITKPESLEGMHQLTFPNRHSVNIQYFYAHGGDDHIGMASSPAYITLTSNDSEIVLREKNQQPTKFITVHPKESWIIRKNLRAIAAMQPVQRIELPALA